MEIANDGFFYLEHKIKKLNELSEYLKKEKIVSQHNSFSLENCLKDQNNGNIQNNEKEEKKQPSNPKKEQQQTTIRKKIKEKSNKSKTKKKETNPVSNKTQNYLEDITYSVINGKIDPEEPVYCFCNYISYGSMVKCDNPKVKIFIIGLSARENGFIFNV